MESYIKWYYTCKIDRNVNVESYIFYTKTIKEKQINLLVTSIYGFLCRLNEDLFACAFCIIEVQSMIIHIQKKNQAGIFTRVHVEHDANISKPIPKEKGIIKSIRSFKWQTLSEIDMHTNEMILTYRFVQKPFHINHTMTSNSIQTLEVYTD